MRDFESVLRHFPELVDGDGNRLSHAARDLPVCPLSGGLINDTYALGDRHILQRLHAIFSASVNRDIDALTTRLLAAGIKVPTLQKTGDGAACVQLDAETCEDRSLHGVWRIMLRLPGRTLHRLPSTASAHSAARLVARFHGALLNYDHEFAFVRPGAHDTPAHMAALEQALSEHEGHRLYGDVAPLAAELLLRWKRWQGPTDLPRRIGHGDLKVSNLLFDEEDQAQAIIDLDTMAWMGLDAELGDALRSWCNRAEEHASGASLSQEILAASLRGYLGVARPWITDDEVQSILPGMLRITLELGARFARDALEETYFGWSDSIAPTRGDHNLLRARNQLELARQVEAAMGGLSAELRALYEASSSDGPLASVGPK